MFVMFHRILIMTNVLAQCVNLILRAEIAYFSKFDQTKMSCSCHTTLTTTTGLLLYPP